MHAGATQAAQAMQQMNSAAQAHVAQACVSGSGSGYFMPAKSSDLRLCHPCVQHLQEVCSRLKARTSVRTKGKETTKEDESKMAPTQLVLPDRAWGSCYEAFKIQFCRASEIQHVQEDAAAQGM